MSNDKYEIKITRRFCKGCGLCVEVCEQEKLSINPVPDKRGIQIAQVRENVNCTGCLKCATICPDGAIEIVRITESVEKIES